MRTLTAISDTIGIYAAAMAGAVVGLSYRGIVFLAGRLNNTSDPK